MTRAIRPSRAAIYVRISNDPEGRRLGVERQRKDCQELADRLGWSVAGIYEDNDVSASVKSRKARPAYQRLLHDAQSGHVDGIIVYNTDRLTRRLSELAQFLEWREGVNVQFADTEGSDTRNANGRMIIQIKGAVAEQEAARISERVTRAARQRAEQGQWHGGHAPYGYRFTGMRGELVVDEEAAPVLTEVAGRILAGETLYGIVADLQNREITTAKGNRWHSRGLKRALLSPALIGCNSRMKPASWRPILGLDTWHSVRDVLTSADRIASGKRSSYTGARKFALSGLVKCGLCGNTMVSQPYGGKASFICSGRATGGCGKIRIRYDDLEKFVVSLTMYRLSGPSLQSSLQAATRDNGALHELRDALRQDEERLRQVGDDYDDDVITRAEWVRRRDRIQARVDKTSRQLAELTSTSLLIGVDVDEKLSETWKDRDVIWRRTLLGAVIDQVRIKPHPKGVATRPCPDPEKRAEIIRDRVDIVWRA